MNQTIGNTVLTTNNPAFCWYLICSGLLVLKMMGVVLLTILHRYRNKIFICEEDAKWLNGRVDHNSTVERTRRAHLNDLENIPNFLIISLCYLFTNPIEWVVYILFGVFVIVRCLHTIVYTIVILPQPTRAGLWLIGFLITGYMAIHTVLYAFLTIFGLW